MIIERKENLENDDADVLAHVVNCQGVMGAGVALSLKKAFPDLYNAYHAKTVMSYDRNKLLGTCYIFQNYTPIKLIANLYAQFNYGQNQRHLNYEALYTSLCELRDFIDKNNIKSVAFPHKMGAGLAGGNWNIIMAMISEIFNDIEVHIIGKNI
jgi:O-acetyl-ADP-ribose deacetylase (regulator of RNase III)